jgi:hypothetical protein
MFPAGPKRVVMKTRHECMATQLSAISYNCKFKILNPPDISIPSSLYPKNDTSPVVAEQIVMFISKPRVFCFNAFIMEGMIMWTMNFAEAIPA